MILTGHEISRQRDLGNITLEPFFPRQVNPNSYNYKLGSQLKQFVEIRGDKPYFETVCLDDFGNSGFVLSPGKMYLAHTFEVIGSSHFAMSLIGRSSIGRLGLFLQLSANLGHVTCAHRWTLELFACKPIRVYSRMIVGQVSFWRTGNTYSPYSGKHGIFNDAHESEGSFIHSRPANEVP